MGLEVNMADLVVGLCLILILGLILRKLFYIPKNRQEYSVCVGCSHGSCSNCDPIQLKENLKKELHNEHCH